MLGPMSKWREEIEELHDVFEAYFLGLIDSLERVDAALAVDFTIVGPHGVESSRVETMQALIDAYGHTTSLLITVTEPRLLVETGDLLMASYIENHQLVDRTNHRCSTVIFSKDDTGPNGLLWRRVHETWIT
jgi:hypothetical protein